MKRDEANGDGGLIIIPVAIMQLEIPLKAKALFGAIWSLVQMKAHKCWASNHRLAHMIGSKVDFRYWEAMRTLEEHGLIRRVIDRKRQREEIQVTWQVASIVIEKTPARNVQGGVCTKSTDPPCTKSTDHRSIESEKRERETTPLPPLPSECHRANGRRKTPDELEAERRRQRAALDARFPPRPGK